MAYFTATRVFSALIFGAVVLPVIANAAEPADDTRIAVVSTNNLDPAKPADRAILRHRIAVAAHTVCTQVTQGDALTSPGYADCASKATADANMTLDRQIADARSRAMVASISQ